MRLQNAALTVVVLVPMTLADAAQDAPPASRPATHSVGQDNAQAPADFQAALAVLDAPDYADRQAGAAAMFELVRTRSELRPFLERAARSHASAEVRAGASAVLARLGEHSLFGETRVTLHVANVHPRQLIAEFARVSGVRFAYWPSDPWENNEVPGAKVSLELDDVPFWEALRRVSGATGLNPVEHHAAGAGGLALSPHGEAVVDAPTSPHGAFVVQLRRLHLSDSATAELVVGPDGNIAANANRNRNLMLEMRLLVEPKIRLAGGASMPLIDAAVDEKGVSLVHPNAEQMGGGGWMQPGVGWSVQANVALDADAARKADRIARLNGRFQVDVALERKTVEVRLSELADLSKLRDGQGVHVGKAYDAGPNRLELNTITRVGEGVMQIEFVIKSDVIDTGDANGWARLNALAQQLALEDAQGRRWMLQSDSTNWEEGAVKVTRDFAASGQPGIGPPHRLVWEAPTKTARVEVPFAFTDIPLPKPD